MIFEKIYDMDNLQAAWERVRVRVNKAALGIDRVRCEDFEKNLAFNLQKIRAVRVGFPEQSISCQHKSKGISRST